MRILHRSLAIQLPVAVLCANSLIVLSITCAGAAPMAQLKPSVLKPVVATKAATSDLPADFPKPDIDGAVMTPDGKPAADAKVTWVTRDKDEKNPLTAATDDQGR